MTNDDGVVTWHNLLKHLNENELEKCIHWQRSWKIGTNFQKKKINKNQTSFDKKFQEVNFFLKNDLLFSLDQPIFIRFFKYLSLNNYLLKKTW